MIFLISFFPYNIDPVSCNDSRESLLFFPLPFLFYFAAQGVQNKLINMDESIYIPITKAEYTVLVEAFKV